MTIDPVTIYSDAELPPDTVIELSSVDEDEPLTLEEGSGWPEPPPEWDVNAHSAAYAADPDVTITEDDTPDEPDPREVPL